MVIIPHRKIKSREATMTFLLDPVRLKTFILDLRDYLRSTQHLCIKKGCDDNPRKGVHSGYHEWPECVPFRRFNHFCYGRGLDWEGCREMMELMLSDRFMCDCEMAWRLTDEQLEGRLSGNQGSLGVRSCISAFPWLQKRKSSFLIDMNSAS